MRTLYLGDVHNKDEPFKDSLKAGGVIDNTSSWEVTTEAKEGNIEVVLLGDTNDRGDRNSEVEQGLFELREQLDELLVHLTGNHEAMMIHAAQHPDREFAKHWVEKQGGSETLIKFKREKVREALDDLKVFLFQGKGRSIVDNLQFMHQRQDVLAVHAGVDDEIAEIILKHGIDRMNTIFLEHLCDGHLSEFAGLGGKYGGALWKGQSLSEKSADALKLRGIRWMINGHISNAGSQVLWESHGINVIAADTSMWRGNPSYTELATDGRLTTWNPKEGRIIVRPGTA